MIKPIEKEAILNAAREEVWHAFTTSEGAKTFFAMDANIQLRINGPYEIYFNNDAGPGLRGSEGCKVLSWVEGEMLSFSWNAPPDFPEIRAEGPCTFIVVRLLDVVDGKTKVRITHGGWKEGGRWQEHHDYFVKAWDVVLGNLRKRFDEGPLW
jgi:uncharacterized protein YndB with AHSA1/START domain